MCSASFFGCSVEDTINMFHYLCEFKCRHSLCVASTFTACSYYCSFLNSFSPFQVKRQKETKRSHQRQIKKKGFCGYKCVVYINSLNRHLSKADTWSWSLLYFSRLLHLPPRRINIICLLVCLFFVFIQLSGTVLESLLKTFHEMAKIK